MVDFSLYLVTDRHQTGGRPLRDVVHAALRAGVRAVQLREKDLPARSLLALARDLAELAGTCNARVFVNDRVDICLASGSAGVHLPAAGLPASAARGLVGADRLIGRSAHSADEAARAEREGADFIVLGPIFETPSKRAFGPPIGLRELERARTRCRVPLFGIGGITIDRVRDVVNAGARGVAVVGSVMAAEDVERASRELLDALEG
ncbi:MAG: thiamine phosphate synthase [Nitrospiraceae bacterium]|nr:MAG: thiamine phosphate synthase [Nitrospiraceae bacterium]